MDIDEPLTQAQGQALLEYAQLTYEAMTAYRRRVAAVALVMATIVGLLCVFSATQWLSTRSRVADVPDEALIEAMGVRIPDPRPAMERVQLRVIAALWAFVTGTTAFVALLFLGVYAFVRPPRVPRHLRAAVGGRDPP